MDDRRVGVGLVRSGSFLESEVKFLATLARVHDANSLARGRSKTEGATQDICRDFVIKDSTFTDVRVIFQLDSHL